MSRDHLLFDCGWSINLMLKKGKMIDHVNQLGICWHYNWRSIGNLNPCNCVSKVSGSIKYEPKICPPRGSFFLQMASWISILSFSELSIKDPVKVASNAWNATAFTCLMEVLKGLCHIISDIGLFPQSLSPNVINNINIPVTSQTFTGDTS